MQALRLVLNAVSDVHGAVENASATSRNHAGDIDRSPSRADELLGSRSAGGTRGALQRDHSWTPTNASYVASDVTDPAARALAAARSQLGVREFGNNSVNAPYNINDAWCASYADWVWDQAGHQVDWTNKNYVPAIWNDAQSMGLAASPTTPSPAIWSSSTGTVENPTMSESSSPGWVTPSTPSRAIPPDRTGSTVSTRSNARSAPARSSAS